MTEKELALARFHQLLAGGLDRREAAELLGLDLRLVADWEGHDYTPTPQNPAPLTDLARRLGYELLERLERAVREGNFSESRTVLNLAQAYAQTVRAILEMKVLDEPSPKEQGKAAAELEAIRSRLRELYVKKA